MKRKQTRKEKLLARSDKFTDSRVAMNTTYRMDMDAAYIAGYKAAMSDARRALRDGDWVPLYDSGINKFLRPIR